MVWLLKKVFQFCYDKIFLFFKLKLKNIFSIYFMATFSNIFCEKTSETRSSEFVCKKCDYICYKKYNWDRHILTSKHLKSTNSNKIATKNEQKEQNEQNDSCHTCQNCGKEYKDRTGLWRHKQKCKIKKDSESETEEEKYDEIPDKNLIMMLINENKELKTMMIEQQNIMIAQNMSTQNMMMKVIENGTHNNITTHTNSHNKAFNLNFFLNETCKDAMNITDFVDSIKLQLSDLEGVGELGYVAGISNIIVKNLKKLDITQRPVHCTDKKRETMYIKDENKWEKDEEKEKLHKVVRKVTCKNQNLIPKFKEKHPDCNTYHSKFSDQYNKIIIESMGGSGDNDYEKEEKIIKNISKQVFIDKEPV